MVVHNRQNKDNAIFSPSQSPNAELIAGAIESEVASLRLFFDDWCDRIVTTLGRYRLGTLQKGVNLDNCNNNNVDSNESAQCKPYYPGSISSASGASCDFVLPARGRTVYDDRPDGTCQFKEGLQGDSTFADHDGSGEDATGGDVDSIDAPVRCSESQIDDDNDLLHAGEDSVVENKDKIKVQSQFYQHYGDDEVLGKCATTDDPMPHSDGGVYDDGFSVVISESLPVSWAGDGAPSTVPSASFSSNNHCGIDEIAQMQLSTGESEYGQLNDNNLVVGVSRAESDFERAKPGWMFEDGKEGASTPSDLNENYAAPFAPSSGISPPWKSADRETNDPRKVGGKRNHAAQSRRKIDFTPVKLEVAEDSWHNNQQLTSEDNGPDSHNVQDEGWADCYDSVFKLDNSIKLPSDAAFLLSPSRSADNRTESSCAESNAFSNSRIDHSVAPPPLKLGRNPALSPSYANDLSSVSDSSNFPVVSEPKQKLQQHQRLNLKNAQSTAATSSDHYHGASYQRSEAVGVRGGSYSAVNNNSAFQASHRSSGPLRLARGRPPKHRRTDPLNLPNHRASSGYVPHLDLPASSEGNSCDQKQASVNNASVQGAVTDGALLGTSARPSFDRRTTRRGKPYGISGIGGTHHRLAPAQHPHSSSSQAQSSASFSSSLLTQGWRQVFTKNRGDMNSGLKTRDQCNVRKQCSICHKWVNANYLTRHIDSLHLNATWPCPFCANKYSDRANLGRHIRTRHPGENVPWGLIKKSN